MFSGSSETLIQNLIKLEAKMHFHYAIQFDNFHYKFLLNFAILTGFRIFKIKGSVQGIPASHGFNSREFATRGFFSGLVSIRKP